MLIGHAQTLDHGVVFIMGAECVDQHSYPDANERWDHAEYDEWHRLGLHGSRDWKGGSTKNSTNCKQTTICLPPYIWITPHLMAHCTYRTLCTRHCRHTTRTADCRLQDCTA